MRRRLVFAAAVLVWWLALLVAIVPVPLSEPFAPADVVALDGRQFSGVLGTTQGTPSGLAITGMDVEQGALQVHPLDRLDASRFSTLRYRFEDFPRTLELVLLIRSDQDTDIQAVTIPTVVSGSGTVDLSALPAWRGRIAEIGFAQYPGAQSVPPAAAFRPFRLVDVELWSPSWTGAIAARWEDWFGARSWSLMSLSALGPDSAVPRGPSLVVLVFVGAAGAVLLGAILLAWRGQRLARMALIAAGVSWLLLDLRWLHGLHARHAVTRDAYADVSADERQRRLPDQALFDSAQTLRQVLAGEPAATRVFVDARSDFERARLLYHLLPLNVAPVNTIGVDTALRQHGAIVVLYATARPAFDAASSTLVLGTQAFPATSLFDRGSLRVYRLTGAAR